MARKLPDEFFGSRPFAEARGGIQMADGAHVHEAAAPGRGELRYALVATERIVGARGDDARERQRRARCGVPAVLAQRLLRRIAFRQRRLEVGGAASKAPCMGRRCRCAQCTVIITPALCATRMTGPAIAASERSSSATHAARRACRAPSAAPKPPWRASVRAGSAIARHVLAQAGDDQDGRCSGVVHAQVLFEWMSDQVEGDGAAPAAPSAATHGTPPELVTSLTLAGLAVRRETEPPASRRRRRRTCRSCRCRRASLPLAMSRPNSREMRTSCSICSHGAHLALRSGPRGCPRCRSARAGPSRWPSC